MYITWRGKLLKYIIGQYILIIKYIFYTLIWQMQRYSININWLPKITRNSGQCAKFLIRCVTLTKKIIVYDLIINALYAGNIIQLDVKCILKFVYSIEKKTKHYSIKQTCLFIFLLHNLYSSTGFLDFFFKSFISKQFFSQCNANFAIF